jgi:arsenite methyltransferase
MDKPGESMDTSVKDNREQSVYKQYAGAALAVVSDLCCSVEYRADYLKIIPDEVIERDYGCGDPSRYVHAGETVLDLGSGGGKICFIAAQVVGPSGQVIGVDCNAEMLALARRNQPIVAERLGFSNVEFRCGRIQDLQLDLDQLTIELAQRPVCDYLGWMQLPQLEARLRRESPLIRDDSIDCVVSNCVLNLVVPQDRRLLLAEVHRVLKPEGRAVISDIVANQDVPDAMQQDPELWSGCISGAYPEDDFVKAFQDAGFHNIQIVSRQSEPWRVIAGIEFRAVTVMAFKGRRSLDIITPATLECGPNGKCC